MSLYFHQSRVVTRAAPRSTKRTAPLSIRGGRPYFIKYLSYTQKLQHDSLALCSLPTKLDV